MLELTDFSSRLIAWQRIHGRHDLPWQNTRDAYRIWLSEIMLQQTQVSTVIPYYARFLERFPTVTALADAPIDDVMALWAGLGYYSRARNLHRCAQVVAYEHGGAFPRTVDELAELPGIGRSTAAAVASFAFAARATILDGNVKRVLARVFGVAGFPGEKKVESAMWKLAESLLPDAANKEEVTAYTQGLMDLGATLCVRGKPDCARCPFASDCVANVEGRQRELPAARPKKAVPTRKTWMLVLRDGDSILLEKRPPTGIWGGLWSLPEASDEAALVQVAHSHGGDERLQRLASFSHTFTHFKLDIEPRLGEARGTPRELSDAQTVWAPLARIDSYGVPAPVRKLIDALTGSLI
ncbi:A/G-specific adenine glycosylase [Candidatus Burkholderia verschuerenii]|uniref:Adenine DNA glycosylase n=1 Tax=Candidatus Burkholderia verschuerenii TaxID=242163 RepID=A0A0L0MFI8_9BURK|nr:A/G-specific adenine glycosylase [Candidatus Burkholderia verschuerenii]KND61078.1 A/G-specific adenine glycosylase [Candidatus Burkholderia verschuerenii]